jgi:hypothetical protein
MMIDKNEARRLLKSAEFRALFVEVLGWDRGGVPLRLTVEATTYELTPAAVKRGLTAYVCSPGPDRLVPPPATRRKIQRQVARLVHEHLIVFVDDTRTTQVWQWVKREVGKPLAMREHYLHASHQGEALVQKLERLAVSLDEEERITVVDVANRLRLAFDVERPTRRFYDRFQSEHLRFLKFIQGIREAGDREWYASVMLNRLMFIYFIQKKGFLDGDTDYLRHRLELVRQRRGKDQFHTFYRQFLLRLFYEGLGQQETQRAKDLEALIGRVPYLNGGMFAQHPLEDAYAGIQIPDEAFVEVLDFFDEFQWHLDDRAVGQDNEINPDVLGHIFERYINQKQMGAYYTKEDVTEYIASTTIVPRLLDMVYEMLPSAFDGSSGIWRFLETQPDRYILPSIKVGVEEQMPNGIDMLSPIAGAEAAAHLSLPRETWRGVLDRRRHYDAAVEAVRSGAVRTTDALVTWNLDVRQFLQDVLDGCESPELLRTSYRALTTISVLDPTCGSGAFLFAAMNILEPLYEAVLDRMAVFVAEAERTGWKWDGSIQKEFRAVLAEVGRHRNRAYFIYRTIAVNNLFGVDLMEEATEICKLRLFLKLASQVEAYGDIEPLPDIDFNIRAGNTLVGYTQEPGAATGELDLADTLAQLKRQAAELDVRFREYRALQTASPPGGEVIGLKQELASGLATMTKVLDRTLAAQYGIFSTTGQKYSAWRRTYAPLHWWADFYAQMASGGFDVVIGNPPYIQATKVKALYRVHGLETEAAPDVYAWILERVSQLVRPSGRTGMIVPLSITFSAGFTYLRGFLRRSYATSWYSHFGRIPSALFSHDVRVRNTIHLGRRAAQVGGIRQQFTTRLHRWFEEERPYLLETLMFAPFDAAAWGSRIPKIHTQTLITVLEAASKRHLWRVSSAISKTRTKHVLYFKKSAYNWLNFCRVQPPCFDAAGKQIPQTKFGEIYFVDARTRDLAFVLLNGKWEFSYWYAIGDDFDVTHWMFGELPASLGSIPERSADQILSFVTKLEQAMVENTTFKLNAGKTVGNYNLAKCRFITDETDALFGRAFGWDQAWPDVQLLYSQAVKTVFADTGGDDD